jgi:hypothetical protein
MTGMTVDLSEMFPECATAEASIHGEVAHVSVRYPGQRHTTRLVVDIGRIANCLEKLRRAQRKEEVV